MGMGARSFCPTHACTYARTVSPHVTRDLHHSIAGCRAPHPPSPRLRPSDGSQHRSIHSPFRRTLHFMAYLHRSSGPVERVLRAWARACVRPLPPGAHAGQANLLRPTPTQRRQVHRTRMHDRSHAHACVALAQVRPWPRPPLGALGPALGPGFGFDRLLLTRRAVRPTDPHPSPPSNFAARYACSALFSSPLCRPRRHGDSRSSTTRQNWQPQARARADSEAAPAGCARCLGAHCVSDVPGKTGTVGHACTAPSVAPIQSVDV